MASVASSLPVDDVASQAHEGAVFAFKIQMHGSNGEAFLNPAFAVTICVAGILSRERANRRSEENRSHQEADHCWHTWHALHSRDSFPSGVLCQNSGGQAGTYLLTRIVARIVHPRCARRLSANCAIRCMHEVKAGRQKQKFVGWNIICCRSEV